VSFYNLNYIENFIIKCKTNKNYIIKTYKTIKTVKTKTYKTKNKSVYIICFNIWHYKEAGYLYYT
jgi:hypothetical protein